MAAIIIPRRHYTQPPGRVAVAPEWSARLDNLWALPVEQDGIYDHVGNKPWMFRDQFSGGRALAWGANQDGYGIQQTSIGIASRQMRTPDALPQNDAWSICGKLRIGGNTGGWGFYGSSTAENTSSDASSILVRISSGKLQLVRTGIAVVATSVANWPTTRLVDFAVTFSGTQARIYFDGRLDVSANYTYVFPKTGPNRSLSLDATASEFVWMGIFREVLTAENVADLAVNPWQLFRADPHRIYSLPPVITIPTLSNPGVIDITANSARPQVTLTY